MLPVDKFGNHSYLALRYFLRVGVCGSLKYPLDLSPLQSLYKYLSLCSQDQYQKWCLAWYVWYFHVASAAILLPICLFFFFKINYLGLQFSVNIFYYCYITLEFLILHHNLVHAFCKSFNFSQSLCKSASMTTFPLRSMIFWIKSYFFNEFNADSDKFKIFVLLSPILSNLLKCLKV